jgi:Uma2 family endonuclease
MSVTTRLITYEESLTRPENRLEEIVRGESRLMPPSTSRHTALLAQLREMLGPQRRFRLLTEAYGLGIRRTPYLHYRIPDLSVFSLDKLERDKAKRDPDDPYIWTPPELLVECLSPSNRKGAVEELLSDYEGIQVPEAWFFYPEQPVLVMHECQNGRLREARCVERGIVSAVPLPGVRVDLDELWSAFRAGL